MLQPKLRFKNFSGEWKEEKLEELSIKIGDGIHSTPSYSDTGKYFFINGNNIKDNKIFISETTKRVDENEYVKYRLPLNYNTILISINGTIGNLGYYNYEKVILGKSCGYIKLKKEVNKYFLLNLLKTNKIQTYFFQELTGTTIKNLSLQTLKNTKIKLPIDKEQKKIADFLSAVDVRIDLTNQKLELLEKYKKGIMQKIFNQELRFKDKYENNYPKWEEKKIEELFKITRGYVLAKIEIKDIRINDYIYPVFSSQTLNNGLMGFYNKYLFENCITWTTDGANAGTVKFRKGKFYCTNVCGVLISDTYNNNCISEILGLETPKHVSYVGNPKLMNNIMSKIKITIPISLEEQQKIADFLSSIDNKIEKLSSKLEELKEFKKGLLQQMFV